MKVTKQSVYLIFTRSYGILQKIDDNKESARAWAARALPGEITNVTRTTASVNLSKLEAEHYAWHARATERTEP